MTTRRGFVSAWGAFALAAGARTRAQPSAPMRRVGIVGSPQGIRKVEEGLRELGWHDRMNMLLLSESPRGDLGRAAEVVREFARVPVDVMVVFTDAAAAVAVAVNRTIPIVMVTTGSVVEDGLVASLARPDRNLTGLSFDPPKDMTGKRLALLKAMAPKASRVAFLIESLGTPGEHEARATTPETQAAARALGLSVFPLLFTTGDQLDAALAEARSRGADGLLLSEGQILNFAEQQRRIHAFALSHRLPCLHSILSAAETGGLMAYGLDVDAFIRRAAYFVDRILKGAKPADLPIEQPTRFMLLLNLRTARQLGLAVPATLRLQADRVIE